MVGFSSTSVQVEPRDGGQDSTAHFANAHPAPSSGKCQNPVHLRLDQYPESMPDRLARVAQRYSQLDAFEPDALRRSAECKGDLFPGGTAQGEAARMRAISSGLKRCISAIARDPTAAANVLHQIAAGVHDGIGGDCNGGDVSARDCDRQSPTLSMGSCELLDVCAARSLLLRALRKRAHATDLAILVNNMRIGAAHGHLHKLASNNRRAAGISFR
jgi:hypothetical protein